MKIVVIGAGGVGGYYGGLLASHGQEVTFICRGAHLEAIRQAGLQVRSIMGDFTVKPALATDDYAKAGIADLVLVCSKTYSMESVFPGLPSLVGPQTMVVSLQNGIDAAERLSAVIGPRHVLGGATWLSSAIEAPGVIRHVSHNRRVAIGELDGSRSLRADAIADAFRPTGTAIEVSDNIARLIWTKFVFIAAVSSFGALTRLEIGAIRGVAETRQQMILLMREVETLSRLDGVPLESDVVEKTLAFMDQVEAQIKPSMQLDVEKGRPFELEGLIGVIGRKGREHGLPTPVADMLYAGLLPVYLKAVHSQKVETAM